ncbi:hypothetical protein GQ457_17G007550 [Hibiscus cannabinus]
MCLRCTDFFYDNKALVGSIEIGNPRCDSLAPHVWTQGPFSEGGKHTIGGRKAAIGCPLSHTMCELMAPRCGRQANNGQEEGPLGCYSRTPCSDSRPLGAGGKHTIGGRKAPSGATLAHHVRTQCPSVREARTQ